MIVNYWVIVNGNLKRLLEVGKVWSVVILCVLEEALKIFVSGLVLHFGYHSLCFLLLSWTVVCQCLFTL